MTTEKCHPVTEELKVHYLSSLGFHNLSPECEKGNSAWKEVVNDLNIKMVYAYS